MSGVRQFVGGVPARIASLPRDARGFPVPRFVEYIDGVPDFRVVNPAHLAACIRRDLCWICGGMLGGFKAFVVGPISCVSRVTSEPPSHKDCAVFAARNCPHLATPAAKRRGRDLPPSVGAPGMHIDRNPGLAVVWIARSYKVMQVQKLIYMGEPAAPLEFYACGRTATRAEIDASYESGIVETEAILPAEAMPELARQRLVFEALLERTVPR